MTFAFQISKRIQDFPRSWVLVTAYSVPLSFIRRAPWSAGMWLVEPL